MQNKNVKIWNWVRDPRKCKVVFQERGKQMQEKDFPAYATDDQIMSFIFEGKEIPKPETKPVENTSASENIAEQVNLNSSNPSENKVTITRKQMIEALDKANIHDYDQSKFLCVKSAYEKAVKAGKVKK